MAPSSDDEKTQPLAAAVTSIHGSGPAEAATPPQGAATPPRPRSGAASPSPSSPSPGTRLLSPPAACAGAAGGAGDFASGASSPVVTRPRGSPPDPGTGHGTPATTANTPQAPAQSPSGPGGLHRNGSLAPGSPSAGPAAAPAPLNAGLDMPKKPLPNTVPVEKPRWYDLYSTRDATFKQMVHQVQEKLSGRRYRYISDRGFMDRMDMQYIREHQERERETEAMQIEEERAEFEYLKAQKKAEEETAALARLRALAGTAGPGTGGPAAGGAAAAAGAGSTAGSNGMTFQPGSPLKASPAKASPVKIVIKSPGAAGPASLPSLPSPGPGPGSSPNASKPAPTGVQGFTFESVFRGSGRVDSPSGLGRDEGGKKGLGFSSPHPVSAPARISSGGGAGGRANAGSGGKGSPNSMPPASPSSGLRGFAAVAGPALEAASPMAPPKIVLPKPFSPLDSPATALQRSANRLGAVSGIGAMLGWVTGVGGSEPEPPSKRAKLSDPVSPGNSKAPGIPGMASSPPAASGAVGAAGGSGSLGTGAGTGGLAAAFASPSVALPLQPGSADCPLGTFPLEPSDAAAGLGSSPSLGPHSPGSRAQEGCQAIVTPDSDAVAAKVKGSGSGSGGASGGMLFSLVAYGASDSDSE